MSLSKIVQWGDVVIWALELGKPSRNSKYESISALTLNLYIKI